MAAIIPSTSLVIRGTVIIGETVVVSIYCWERHTTMIRKRITSSSWNNKAINRRILRVIKQIISLKVFWVSIKVKESMNINYVIREPYHRKKTSYFSVGATFFLLFGWIERFLLECRKTKTKSNYSDQSQQTQAIQWTNQNTKQVHVTGPGCRKRLLASHD